MPLKSPIAVMMVCLALLIAPHLTLAAQTDAEPLRILRLDSNHAEFPWSGQIHLGVLAGLADSGYEVDGTNVVIDEFFMDTKRNTSPEYFTEIGEEAIAYIEETQPDIVIANDDNAARLVVQPMRDVGIPFVLLGLNGNPVDYELVDSPNVAGVLERPHIDEMMAWIEQVMGDDTRLSVLAEDSPTTERMFGDGTIVDAIESSAIELIDVTFTNDYELWQEFVQSADETNDVLFLGAYATLRDADDVAVEPVDVLAWTIENSPIPVMGFWEEAVHNGTLGGPVISGFTQGYEAAVRAAEILDGASPAEIGFSVPARGKLIINLNAMRQWDVQVPLNLLEVSEIVES